MRKITLKFFPNDRKKNATTGRTPVYMQITNDGDKKTKRLDIELTEEEREAWNDILGRVDIQNSYTNRFLDGIEQKFTQLKLSDFKDIYKMSSAEIRDFVLGIKHHSKKTMTITEYIDEYYASNIHDSIKFQKSTKTNYRKAIKHLTTFIYSYKLEHKRVIDLDFEFAKKFSSYLMSNDSTTGRIGMSEVSACGIIKKFRTIFDQAIEEDLITRNSFKQVKLSYTSPEKPHLSLQQYQSLIAGENITSNERDIVDFFLLMSLTGCAYTDCAGLTSDNIEKLEDGIFRLKYNRNKTGLESQQFLCSQAIRILEQFEQRADVQLSKFLTPRFSNQHVNRTLKMVALKLEIPLRLTSHTARHTFRQLLDEADIVDQTLVNKMMGWSNRAGMDSVYRRVTDTRLMKTKNQFDDFINSIYLNIR